MKILDYLSSIFEPEVMEDLKTDEILSALSNVDVRKHWTFSVLEEMRAIHQRTHMALLHGTLTDDFVKESARLQGINWVLWQILNSKTSVDLEKHHNQDNTPSVAVQPAP